MWINRSPIWKEKSEYMIYDIFMSSWNVSRRVLLSDEICPEESEGDSDFSQGFSSKTKTFTKRCASSPLVK